MILLVVVVIWAIGALLASLGAWLVAITAQYAIGALVAALVVGIEMLITGILTSTVFWVAASAYGIYSGYKTIKESKNNPNLTRNDAAYEYGYGTAEIILSLIPFWGKFKGRTKGENSKTNNAGKFEDDLMNKPSDNSKSMRELDDFTKTKKSGKFEESSLDEVKGGDKVGESNPKVAKEEIDIKYWKEPKQINGRKVYQRDDLFDPNFKDADGLTNVERMKDGLSPIGYDGEKINMHHLTQTEPGPMAEVGGKFHSDNSDALHFPDQKSFRRPDGRKADWPKSKTGRYKSTSQSNQYNAWRKNYWKIRANDFKE